MYYIDIYIYILCINVLLNMVANQLLSGMILQVEAMWRGWAFGVVHDSKPIELLG